MDEANNDEMHRALMDLNEGVLATLQVLIVALGKSGALDTAEYCRLLTDYRLQHVDQATLQATVIDRVLSMMVDEPVEVLLRRAAMHVAPTVADRGTPGDG